MRKRIKKLGIIMPVIIILAVSAAIFITIYTNKPDLGKQDGAGNDNCIEIWNTAAGNHSGSKLDDMNIDFNSSWEDSAAGFYRSIPGAVYQDVERNMDTYTYFHEIQAGYEQETYEDQPYMIPYPAEGSDCAVIVIPGGGYGYKSMDGSGAEGHDVAVTLQNHGINAFVLHYRSNPYEYPIPQLDVQRAVRYLKANADGYGINPAKIGLLGFSAGGYQAGSYINLVQGRDLFPDDYTPDEIDKIDDSIAAPAMIYPALTFRCNVGMLFCLFDDEDVRDAGKREELLDMLDLKQYLDHSANLPQFISYGTADTVVGDGPKEYIAAAQAAGIDVTIAIAEGKNHAYGQDYYMEQYLEWIKEIFGKVS